MLYEVITSKEDRRYVIIHLTSKGRKLIQEAFPDLLVSLVHKFDSLSENQLLDLGDYCKEIGLKAV